MRYFLIAGEASGDLHGAHLIRAIKAEDPSATFAFMGGDQMETPPRDSLHSSSCAARDQGFRSACCNTH